MLLSKNKIRLSRSLHARTTPYPKMSRYLKYSLLAAIFALAAGAIIIARPNSQNSSLSPEEPKQILGEQESKVEYLIYEIKKGDTLFNLSQKYSVSWQTLAELNNLKEPFTLKIHQKLKIPSP